MAASLISFLSIFYSINLNHVSRQNEQNTKRADTKPIAIAFVSEFEHVAAEIITHCFHSLPNAPEFDDANVNAPIHASDEWVFEESPKSRAHDCATLFVLQLRAYSPIPSRDARDGSRNFRSRMVNRGNDRSFAELADIALSTRSPN